MPVLPDLFPPRGPTRPHHPHTASPVQSRSLIGSECSPANSDTDDDDRLRSRLKRPPLPPWHKPPLKLHVAHWPTGTRSPSPSSLSSLSHRARSLSTGTRSPSILRSSRSPNNTIPLSTPPRRTFPRDSPMPPVPEPTGTEESPVIFDASLNFVLGCEKQRVRQSFRPTASHLDPATASSYLSSKISQFLKRTDHVMDEWRSLGHRDEAEEEFAERSAGDWRRGGRGGSGLMGRSRSATNIMIKGFQYYSRAESVGRCGRSWRSVSRASEDGTLSDTVGQEVKL